MMVALKVRKIGNSLGVILPQAALDALHSGEDDTVYLTRSADGVRVTPYDPEFERQMELAHKIAKKRRNAYRELARR
jgi:putative addiction module antidote